MRIFNVTDDVGNETEETSLAPLLAKLGVEIERVVRVECECTVRIHNDVNDIACEFKITDGGEEFKDER